MRRWTLLVAVLPVCCEVQDIINNLSAFCWIFFAYSSIRHLQPLMSLNRLILEVPRSHTVTHYSR
jgi:hypothetical protein